MIELVVPFSTSGGTVVSVNGKVGVVVLTPEDIGALPTGALEGYATESYVREQIAGIEIPETDLTGYATETYVQEKIAEAELGGEDIDLSAYATKQYVSEQVNAIELMPGPQGPAGKDGEPGKDGLNGADGYTPIKGVDYFDGVDGAPGADGQDYVLTEADKQEIAGMVEVTGGGRTENTMYWKGTVARESMLTNFSASATYGDVYYATNEGNYYMWAKTAGIDGWRVLSTGMSAADYYTKTEINNKGYQTAAQVQTLIDGIDMTGYYTKTEVEGLGYQTAEQVQALINASIPASGEEVSY